MHLSRRAVVYIRQSTPHQVVSNQESLRLQYALQQRARELGSLGSLGGEGEVEQLSEGERKAIAAVSVLDLP